MNRIIRMAASCLCVLVFASASVGGSSPTVTAVTATPRTDGSGVVDIWYTLEDDDGDQCTITVQVSDDGGSTWTVPAATFLADSAIGPNIAPGRRRIQWDSKADLPGVFGTNFRIKVTADDGASGPDMVRIPGGTFQMGDSFSEGDSDERPVHTVTLSSFYMSRCEITNGQYRDFLQSALAEGLITVSGGVVYRAGSGTSYLYCNTSAWNSHSQIAYSGGVFSVRTKGGRSMVNDPMVMVGWYGAAAYCNWRSQQEGRQPCYNLSTWTCDFGKNGYHLPTEVQWEYAARGGLSGKRFPWGNTITHSQANYESDSYFSYDISPTRGYHHTWNDGIYPYTCPVDSFVPNGHGLHNMAGNVWEWCNDWYSDSYYGSSPQINPIGPTSGTYRVLRGGGWGYSAGYCRVANRNHSWPGHWGDDGGGFRVSLDF
jgi:formylglycine-generating enzyme